MQYYLNKEISRTSLKQEGSREVVKYWLQWKSWNERVAVSLEQLILYSNYGLPDFYWYMIPKPEKMYQMNTKCTKRS
jgi:hypothetical protein